MFSCFCSRAAARGFGEDKPARELPVPLVQPLGGGRPKGVRFQPQVVAGAYTPMAADVHLHAGMGA
jgi:hypothetical protein